MLTPYEAERWHKSKEEDILTSRFFGHVCHFDPELQKEFLAMIGVNVDPTTDISLWGTLQNDVVGKREVDGIMKSGGKVIVIEDKLRADFDVSQLVDEGRLGREVANEVEMLCLSSHYTRPAEVSEAERHLGFKVAWASWSQCLTKLRGIESDSRWSVAGKQNLEDLIVFMESKGFESEKGFSVKDDWNSFFEMFWNTEQLLDQAGDLIEKAGFKRLHSGQDKSFEDEVERPCWGRNYYWYASEHDESLLQNDYGFFVRIGIFEGEPQVEFSAYVPLEATQDVKLPEGYLTEKRGPPEYEEEYTFYLRCFPIGRLKSQLLDEQIRELGDFIVKCLEDLRAVFPKDK